jgi:hypothetical protein
MKSAAGKYVRPCSNIEANRLWALTRIEELRLMFDENDQSIGATRRAVLNAEFANLSKFYAEGAPSFIDMQKETLDILHDICTDLQQSHFFIDGGGSHVVHTQLNTIIEVIIILAFHEYFGRPSTSPMKEGTTLWSRLNWVLSVKEVDDVARAKLGNDPQSTDSYTVASLWRNIQHDLSRKADAAIDAALLSDLIVALKGEDGLGGLNASLNTLCEEVGKVGATDIVSKSNDLLKKSKDFYELIGSVSEKRAKLKKLFAAIGYEPLSDSISWT